MAAFTAPAGDAGPRFAHVRELSATAPTLEREFCWHLEMDDEAAWRAYGLRAGPRRLMDAYESLQFELQSRPFEEFVRVRPRLEACLLRVGVAIDECFDYSTPRWHALLHMHKSARESYELRRLTVECARVLTGPAPSAASRMPRLDALIGHFAKLGDLAAVESVQLSAAQFELEAGRPERFRARLEAARTLAGRLGDHYLMCQILGQLAAEKQRVGDDDSLQLCLRDGFRLARRHAFTDHVVRFTILEVTRDIDLGHLALAADRLQEATELVEERGDAPARVRLLRRRAALLADLGCWELVDRALRRLPVTLREMPSNFGAAEAAKNQFDADLLRARAAFARSEMDPGRALLASWVDRLPVSFRRVGLAQVFDVWSEGAMRAARWDEAARVCLRGETHCDSAHVPEFKLGFALRRARALEGAGRITEARSAAAEVERLAGADGRLRADDRAAIAVLEARLRLRCGDLEAGRRLLRLAMRDSRAGGGAAGLEGFGSAGTHSALSARDAVHALAQLSPAAGYGFEMEWRSLARSGAARTAEDPLTELRYPGNGMHLVFCFTQNHLLRWTATGRGVRLDTLPVLPAACLEDVRQAVRLLRTEPSPPGRWWGPQLERLLRRMADQLLPRGIDAFAGRGASIEISPDGPLLSLPFEALPVEGTRGDVPLALVADVAYPAGWGAHAPARSPGAAVILSNPATPLALCRRYAWSGALQGSDDESRAALQRWPGALLLNGAMATRRRFLGAANGSSELYVASHYVRDPGAPFLGFIPLAAGSDHDAGSPIVEVSDIRGLDLSGCRLAVLASCASGAPQRVSEQPGRSLGDAFLDAGAHAVVRSFWEVEDEETRDFMKEFLVEDARAPTSVQALARARRTVMRRAGGAQPRVWAAWSIARTWADESPRR